MTNINQALVKLKGSIDRLDGGVRTLEYSLAGRQRDMFASPAAPAAAKQEARAFPVENAVIAQRLDKAIRKVEELLEG